MHYCPFTHTQRSDSNVLVFFSHSNHSIHVNAPFAYMKLHITLILVFI